MGQLPTATEIARRARLSAPAKELLNTHERPDRFMASLRREKLYADAIVFTALCLTPQAGIWWGCLCLWELYREGMNPEVEGAIQSAVDWVLEPDESKRRAAGLAADELDLGSPAGNLVRSVFFSGGSLTPIGLPEVSPAPTTGAQFLSAAILAASRKAPAAKIAGWQCRFLELLDEMAAVRPPWLPDPAL